jgi:hypothetical protein
VESESLAGHDPGSGQTLASLADAVEAMSAEMALADPVMMLSAAARLERLSRRLADQVAAAAIGSGTSCRDAGAAYGVSKQAAQ